MCIISFLDEGYKNMNKNNNNTGDFHYPQLKARTQCTHTTKNANSSKYEKKNKQSAP